MNCELCNSKTDVKQVKDIEEKPFPCCKKCFTQKYTAYNRLPIFKDDATALAVWEQT